MGLIYELTADTFDATEAAEWVTTADGATIAVESGRIRITADEDAAGRLVRTPLDVGPGRYVHVVDITTATNTSVLTSADLHTNRAMWTQSLTDRYVRRDVQAWDVDPTDDPLVPEFRNINVRDGVPLYLDRYAVYEADSRHLLDQLDVQILTQAGPGFRLDTDQLDTGTLGDRETATAWTDYLTPATGLTIDRGADVDGVETTTQVGTVNLTVYSNPDDPPGLGLRPNLPIRVRSRMTETVAYTGAVGDLVDTWRKPTGPEQVRFHATVPCVDAVRDLAGISRYGALGIDTWSDRIRRLMASFTGRWAFAAGTPEVHFPICSRTVLQTTLDKHLQIAASTSGGRWFVDRDNVVRVQPAYSADVGDFRLYLTDGAAGAVPSVKARTRYYTDLVRTYDTRVLVNDLVLTNHGAALDDKGAWVADDADLGPYTDMTSAATYGVRHADVETTLEVGPGDVDNNLIPTATAADDLAALYMTRADLKVRYTSVTYDATNDVDVACSLDVYDYVMVANGGAAQLCRVIGIHHTITSTPQRWLVTLDLQGV